MSRAGSRASGPNRKRTGKTQGKRQTSRGAVVWRVLFQLALWGGALGLATVAGVFIYFSRDLPTVDALRDHKFPQTTRILDRNGVVLAELASERRTVVPMEKVPRHLVLAVLAAEDADFYLHEGLDYPGIARAVARDVLSGRKAQGASTITQQVVKLLLLTPERTLTRKIKELILARRLEQYLTKDEILFLYLNHINFGHGRYGVQEASQYYFGKDVQHLTLAEATLIAGIPQAPARLSPRGNMEAARRRQRFVLGQLERKRESYWPDLDAKEIAQARSTVPQLVDLTPSPDPAPEVRTAVLQWLKERVPPATRALGGFTVYTTLDAKLQGKTRAAVRKGLDALDKRQKYKKAKEDEDTSGARTWGPEAAAYVLDTDRREVLAWVGGYGKGPGFDRATQAKRQPGSSFKPFVYALAIQSREFTPASLLVDAPTVYEGWQPKNYRADEYQGHIPLRRALALSINSVAVRLIEEVTPEAVAQFARDLGITTSLEATGSLALGASEVHLSEMVNAYATFAAGGRWQPTRWLTRVVGPKGQDIRIDPPEPPREVLSRSEAYVVTSLLQSVIQDGTGRRARALGFDVAGKTGTTNGARDAWFVGYSPRRVAGVWVGFDTPQRLGRKEGGSRSALPIWVDIMGAAHGKGFDERFVVPEDVEQVRIDPVTGLRAFEGMEGAVDEIFLDGTAPQEEAPRPDMVDTSTFLLEQL